MNGKMKKIAAMAFVLGVVSIAFLAAPIQAYVTRTGDSDLLQTQDQDRLRTQDCDILQTQTQERLRAQETDCNRDMLHTQERERLRTRDRECSCMMNMEQYRYQYREKTGNLGN